MSRFLNVQSYEEKRGRGVLTSARRRGREKGGKKKSRC